MGFKNKIITVSLVLIVGLSVLSSGTCGRNRRDFSAFARSELASHTEREPAEIKGKDLRS